MARRMMQECASRCALPALLYTIAGNQESHRVLPTRSTASRPSKGKGYIVRGDAIRNPIRYIGLSGPINLCCQIGLLLANAFASYGPNT